MPGFNQNGPAGQGPMTGWGQGICRTGAGGLGAGMGRGAGGRCRRVGFGYDQNQAQSQGLRRRAMSQADIAESTNVSLKEYEALREEYKKVQKTLAELEQKLTSLGDEKTR